LNDYRVLQPNNDFLGNRPRNRSEHHVGIIRSLQTPTCIRILVAKQIGIPFTPTAFPRASSNLPQQTNNPSPPLSTAAKAGIGVGSVFGVALLIGTGIILTILFLRRRRRRNEPPLTPHPTPTKQLPRNGRPRRCSRSKEMVSRRSLAQRSRRPERGGRVGWKECEGCAGAAGGIGC
jgi:hypothetical protein